MIDSFFFRFARKCGAELRLFVATSTPAMLVNPAQTVTTIFPICALDSI
jgi:hypothetical protein